MPKKAKDLSEGLTRLRAYVQGQTVQPGMFSTLDELIQEAPFEANSLEQWQAYLKPGRMLKREGAQFPLKKEEIDYAFSVIKKSPDEKLTKEELRDLVQLYRPHMKLDVGREMVGEAGDPISPRGLMPMPGSWVEDAKLFEQELPPNPTSRFPGELRALGRVRLMDRPEYGTQYQGGERLFHHSPESLYEESVTGMQGLDHSSHFSPDTVSWSRASTHYVVPGEPQGSVRLVEEIQSDLHSEAADKLTYDPETMKVYPYDFSPPDGGARRRLDISPEQQARLETMRRGYRTPEDMEALDDVKSRLRALKTARTDLTVEQRDFLEERGWGMDRLPEEFMDRRLDLSTEIDKLERMQRLLQSKLPDAPYKNPKDYGALELRKQLLNAVEEGNDYLALTRGADQIDRYAQGMDAQSRKGMMHIYDKVYKGELDRLAKRYGAEVVEIPVNVTSSRDVRPPLMADFGLENITDFTDYVTDSLHETGDITDAVDAVDDLLDVVKFVETKMEGNLSLSGFDPGDVQGLKEKIMSVRTQVNELFEPVIADKPNAVDEWNASVMSPLGDIYSDVHDLYEGYELFWSGGTGGMQEKIFPAIRLTDEVKDRVRKLGVPQFQEGGLVSFLSALRKPNEGLKPGYELVLPEEVMAGMTEEDWMKYAAAQERISGQSESELMELQALMSKMQEREASEARMRDPEYWKDAAKFVPAYFSAMWKSLDEETGEPTWVAPMQPLRPELMTFGGMDEETWISINDKIMEHNKKFRPGIIDDTISIRALGTAATNLLRDEPIAPPEYAMEAMERSEQMARGVEEQYGLEAPVGLPQHAAGALGTMLAQVPSPKSAADVVSSGVGKAARFAKMPEGLIAAGKAALFPARAGAEFFDPTVAPGVKQYLMGTAFGGTLGSVLEPTEAERRAMEMEREQELGHVATFVEQSWDDQAPDVKMQMLSHPDPTVRETIWNALSDQQKMEAIEQADEMGLLEMSDAEQE